MLARTLSRFDPGFVIRPSVLVTAGYLLAVRAWSIWYLCTMTFDDVEAQGRRLLTPENYQLTSVANAVLGAVLLVDARIVVRGTDPLRRAWLSGIALALASLAWIQFGALRAIRPLEWL